MWLRSTVAARLRQLRVEQKLSQGVLAKRSGLSVSYVSMLERGLRVPALDTLEALSRGLGVSPLRLLGGGDGKRR